MAKDILEAIRAAEDTCREREAQAKVKKQAADLLAQSEREALSDREQALDKANAAAEQELLAAKEQAERQCGEISRLAEKNRPRVIQTAADALLN